MTSGSTRIRVADTTEDDVPIANLETFNDTCTATGNKFHLFISSSSDWTGGNVAGSLNVRKLSASLNPSDTEYVGNTLNTDPDLFGTERHLLYLDFPVDIERATTVGKTVEILSGSHIDAGENWDKKYGDYQSRYTTSKSPYVISQRFGTRKYDLFYFESLSDGKWANENIKISVTNVRRPVSDTELYGTFTLVVRKFDDTDNDPVIMEQHTNLDLNPNSENYIIRRIGDKSIYFDWDQSDDDERRLVVDGDYANRSTHIRVIPSNDLKNGVVPTDALPWGFKGYPLMHTKNRLFGDEATIIDSTIPPIPFRVNVGKKSSTNKTLNTKLHWGVHFERASGSAESVWSGRDDGYINASLKHNNCLDSMARFMGINHAGQDVLLSGSNMNDYSATVGSWYNEFSLEKIDTAGSSSKLSDAKYWQYKGTYDLAASNAFKPDSTYLNKFANVAKFSFFFYGGFDGTDMLDKNSRLMRDDDMQATEFTVRNVVHGNSLDCNTVKSYRTAIDIVANPENVDTNLLAIPDIRDGLVTDYAVDAVEDRFDCFYIMDAENVDEDGDVIFDNPVGQDVAGSGRPSVENTISQLETRGLDTNFAATYWPDVRLYDEANNKVVTVPPSVVVMGAFAFNDKVAQPWFAPAGFNRGGLTNVRDADVRLTHKDRGDLYDANVNPIAQFPKEGVLILGQKTLQAAQSALDRVNVRRMVLEVRRAVKSVAQKLLFEPNTFSTWERFVSMVNPILERVQSQSGLEKFKVVMDDTTTSQSDVENYVMKGMIYLAPTKAAEFISIDFVITNAGVEFA